MFVLNTAPSFLNGVCRHEHVIAHILSNLKFLNGVCRHEHVVFFKDGNGVGDSWIDFSHDIILELVHEWSDENITLLDINEDYVVEWIAERTYLAMEKDCENF